MYNDVSDLDGALEHIAGLIDQVRGKLGDRFLRLELADRLAPKSTPFRVPSGPRRGIPLDLAEKYLRPNVGYQALAYRPRDTSGL